MGEGMYANRKTPSSSTPVPSGFVHQRPFPVPTQDTSVPPETEVDLQAKLEIARRASPDITTLKFSAPRPPAGPIVPSLYREPVVEADQRPSAVQAKLTVGAPNDQYEQEADVVAAQVMAMPEPTQQPNVQKQTIDSSSEEEEAVQTKPIAHAITPLVQREAAPEAEEDEIQPKLLGNIAIQREVMAEDEEVQAKPLAQPLDQGIAGRLQREAMPEDEEAVQSKPLGDAVLQRESMPEEEEPQAKALNDSAIQREAIPETDEEELQTKRLEAAVVQREALPDEEEAVQTKPLGHNTVLQREAVPEEEEAVQPKRLQRFTDGSLQPGSNLETKLSSSRGGGSPLSDDVRSFMEPRFGADLSQVRVHTDASAVQMNKDLSAQAFTHKQDIYFGAGKSPGKDDLTAHELTHVVQQTGGVQAKTYSKQTRKGNKLQAKAKFSPSTDLQPALRLRESPQEQQLETTNKAEPLQKASPVLPATVDAGVKPLPATPEVETRTKSIGETSPQTVSDAKPEQIGSQASIKTQSTPAAQAEAAPKPTLSTPDLGAAPTSASLPKTDNGVQPVPQTQLETPTGAGSNELAQFVQQASVHRESLMQSAEQKKQQIRKAAQAEKQDAQQSISTEEKRLEDVFSQTVERIQQATVRTRTQILSERDAKIEATRATAQVELSNLQQVVVEKQNALREMGNEKAKSIASAGQEQAQRAISTSNQKASEANAIASSEAQQYASSQHANDIASGAQQMASKVTPGIQKAGGDMAQAASKGANDLANSFQKGAAQLSEKFNQALQDGQQKILQIQDQTISGLNQIAQESLSKLESSSQEAVAKLQSGKQNAVQQLHAGTQGGISNIDKSSEDACGEVDKATTQGISKLNSFTADVSASLSTSQGEAGLETVQAAQKQLDQFQTEWNGALNRFSTDALQTLQNQVKQIHAQVNQQVDQAAAPIQQAGTDFETKANDVQSQVSQKVSETATKAAEAMQKVTTDVGKELQNRINESESKFNSGLDKGKANLTSMVDQGLAKHDQALSQISTNVASLATKASSSVVSAVVDFVKAVFTADFWKGVWDGFWGAIGGIWDGLKGLLSAYWENLKKGDFWTWVITIAVVVIVVILAVTGVLPAVLAFLGEVLLYAGLFLGVAAATYYILDAVFTPGLSPYERGKSLGKALFEILLIWLSWKGIAKGAGAAGEAGAAARLAELVPDAKLLARLKAIVSDEAKLIELLETWKDAEKLADILEKVGDVGRAEALLKQFGSLEELWQMLQKPDITVTILEDLLKVPGMTVAELKDLLKIPGMTATDLKDLLKIPGMTITELKDFLKVPGMTVTELKDFLKVPGMTIEDLKDFLTTPGMTVSKLKELLKLPGMSATELKNLLTLPGMTVEQLEKLVALTDDVAQLKRFLQLVTKAEDLELYLLMAGGKGQAARLLTLLEKAASLGDVKKVESLLNLAGGNATEFERLANAVSNFSPPTGGGTLSNLHGYSGADMAHFEGRHTFNFDFINERIKPDNTLWPKGTDISQMLEEALTILDKEVPPFRLTPFAKPPKVITLSNGTKVQIGANNANEIGQFFPVKGTGNSINFIKQEMEAFKKLIVR